MGSDASKNTSMTAEHARHTIQVLAKEPVASNSTPETMAPTVPKIALKDKGIGLMAMPAGLKGKVGRYRWSAI